MKKKIIDISYYQPVSAINYKELATDVGYVFLRGQYGSTKKDIAYDGHAKALEKVGVPYGAYAYALFTSESDARVEARDFIKRIKGSNPTTLVIDVEEKTVRVGTHYGSTMAFIDECRKLTDGKIPIGLYTGHSFYSEYSMHKVTNADFLWIPRYSGTAQKGLPPKMKCDIWQYTDKGTIKGYKGKVDINVLMNDKIETILLGKKQETVKPKPPVSKPTVPTKPPVSKPTVPTKPPVSKPTVSTTKPPVSKPTETATAISLEEKKGYHVVKSGDTLGEIAKAHKTTVVKLAEINGIKNINVISVGQKIYLKKKPLITSKKSYINVKSGDTCSQIAERYKVTLAQLKKWNKLDAKYTIYVGQKLRVK